METPNRIHPLADPAESWQTKGEQIPLSGGPQKGGSSILPGIAAAEDATVYTDEALEYRGIERSRETAKHSVGSW